MRLKITNGTVCDGERVKPGDVVETSRETALVLISNGKAVLLDEVAETGGLTTQSAAALIAKPDDEDAPAEVPESAPKRRRRKVKDSSK